MRETAPPTQEQKRRKQQPIGEKSRGGRRWIAGAVAGVAMLAVAGVGIVLAGNSNRTVSTEDSVDCNLAAWDWVNKYVDAIEYYGVDPSPYYDAKEKLGSIGSGKYLAVVHHAQKMAGKLASEYGRDDAPFTQYIDPYLDRECDKADVNAEYQQWIANPLGDNSDADSG